jgi:5-formyltetrahydrofolate cyclo-ligase
LQEHAKEIRCSLSREEIEHHSLLIERHLWSVIDGESPILVYVSKASEVDTRRLLCPVPFPPLPMKKIGIAFSCLEVPEIPGDKNDVAMDPIVTEKGIIEPR